jgi:predicted dehydrogenase
MLAKETLDVVSICLPTPLHAEAVLTSARARIRGIFCEKPLAGTIEDGYRIIEQCRRAGSVLAVNYTRRWDRNYLWPRQLLQQGFIGRLERMSGIYSGQLFNIGTHLIDAMLMYAGEVEWVTGERSGPSEAEDPTVAGLLRFRSGVLGTLLPMPERTDLVFETDLLGTEGRMRIVENGRRVELYRFRESSHYSGYRELVSIDMPNPLPGSERLVEAIQDLIRCLHNSGQPACSGEDALATLETAAALCRSAQNGGSRQTLMACIR